MRRAYCLFLVLALFCGGCNHLFYFPDHHMRVTPDKLGLPYTEHTLQEEDGTELRLWHIPPKGQLDRRAVFVHFHGNAENMTTHVLFVAWLAARGFDVVTFDYRGYGKSTGEPGRGGLIADGQAVLAWVGRQPELKGKAIFVLGQSLGGAVSVPVVASMPDAALAVVKGLVVESTFDSYRGIARGKLSDIWLTWPLQWPLSFLVSDGQSPVDAAPKLKLPVVVIHGDADPVIPLEYGRRLFDAFPGPDKEFWTVPGGGHTPAFVDDESPWKDKLVTWACQRGAHC